MTDYGYKKIDLKLPPSLEQTAKEWADSQGYSLHFLISLAIEEKIARMTTSRGDKEEEKDRPFEAPPEETDS